MFLNSFADFVNLFLENYGTDDPNIYSIQGYLDEEMKVDGWISLILSNRTCLIMKYDNGVFMNEGYVWNDEKVLKVLGNDKIGDISYNEESIDKKE